LNTSNGRWDQIKIASITARLTYHVITAFVRFEAKSNVALIINGSRVREFVSLKMNLGHGGPFRVFKLSHDFVVDRTPVKIPNVSTSSYTWF